MLSIVLAAVLAVLGFIAPGPRPMTLPTIGVTIDGGTVTSQLLSATWNLGISDFLADLAPNTASLLFKGQLSVSPADAVVISAGGTAMWTGRVDSYVERRDVNGDYWSSVSATDVIGALGVAEYEGYTLTPATMDGIAENIATNVGIIIDVVDSCSRGLINITGGYDDYATYSGQVLPYINQLAKASNAMLAMQHDGTIKAYSRQALYSPTVSNGTFDTNTTGWSNVLSGTISRVTASPHTGAGNARIVSSATQFSGADSSSISGTFRKDHTYRLTFWGRSISGSTSIIGGVGDQGASDFNNAVHTLTGSWAAYTADWTPTSDRTSVSVIFRNTIAVTNTFEVDDVAVTEVVNATDISASIVEWEKTTSIDSNVNSWIKSNNTLFFQHNTDPATYGERWFDARGFGVDSSGGGVDGVGVYPFYDWADATGGIRDVVTRGELVVSSSTSPLLALDPLDWVNDGSDSWQIMSMQWSAAPGEPWRLTITADDLIALL